MTPATLALLLLAAVPAASGGWFLESEAGMAFPGYNDVRIPGEGGSDISLTDDLEADPGVAFRLRFGREIGRHRISLFAAPLRLNSSGAVDTDVCFDGTVFPAGTELEARYRFDSYRLTWRYQLVRGEDLQLGLGLSAKVRDASISLEGGGQEAVKTNTGFVPLISFGLDWRISEKLRLLLDGDALAGPQGRAEDVLLGAGWAFDPRSTIYAGFRVLEGGADVEEVYNFTMVGFAVIGFRLAL